MDNLFLDYTGRYAVSKGSIISRLYYYGPEFNFTLTPYDVFCLMEHYINWTFCLRTSDDFFKELGSKVQEHFISIVESMPRTDSGWMSYDLAADYDVHIHLGGKDRHYEAKNVEMFRTYLRAVVRVYRSK